MNNNDLIQRQQELAKKLKIFINRTKSEAYEKLSKEEQQKIYDEYYQDSREYFRLTYKLKKITESKNESI